MASLTSRLTSEIVPMFKPDPVLRSVISPTCRLCDRWLESGGKMEDRDPADPVILYHNSNIDTQMSHELRRSDVRPGGVQEHKTRIGERETGAPH